MKTATKRKARFQPEFKKESVLNTQANLAIELLKENMNKCDRKLNEIVNICRKK